MSASGWKVLQLVTALNTSCLISSQAEKNPLCTLQPSQRGQSVLDIERSVIQLSMLSLPRKERTMPERVGEQPINHWISPVTARIMVSWQSEQQSQVQSLMEATGSQAIQDMPANSWAMRASQLADAKERRVKIRRRAFVVIFYSDFSDNTILSINKIEWLLVLTIKVANHIFLSSQNIIIPIQQHQIDINRMKVTVMIYICPNLNIFQQHYHIFQQHYHFCTNSQKHRLQCSFYKKHQQNRLTCSSTKSQSLGQFIQYLLYYLKTAFNEMTETPQPVAKPPHNLTCQKYRELLNKKDQTIRQQETVISTLKEKMKKAVAHAKNVRENKFIEFYMEKYEQQYQLRTAMEQAVFECINNLTRQLDQIQQTINNHLTDQLRTPPFTLNRKSNTSNLISTHLSQLPQTQVPMVDSITFGCAAPNKIDMGQALLQLKTRMIYLQAVTEILVTKVEKKELEQHRDAGIRNSYKEINEELGQLRKELRKQQQINSQLSKQLNIYRDEKQKWRQNFMIVGQAKHVERLMVCSKESLVEQIVKLMYCMRIVEQKKQENEKELKDFRSKEKERYEHFLYKIRSQKKIPAGPN